MKQKATPEIQQRVLSMVFDERKSFRDIAKACNVSTTMISRIVAADGRSPAPLPKQPQAPFSGQPQSPANVPPPNWNADQPIVAQRRPFDQGYHGHTFQSFSAPLAFDGFDLDRTRNALSLHRMGNFLESSLLSLVVLGFAPVMAALGQRVAPALAMPRHIRAGNRGLSRILGAEIERQLVPRAGLIPSEEFPSTLYGSTAIDIAMMGFSVLQHAFGDPDPETGIRTLYTRRWPTWAVQYYRYRRTYVAITTDGPVDILNDGKFTLIGDSEEPHLFGAILALAEEAFDGICTRRARAAYIDKYGNPKWVGTMPQGVAPNSPEGDAMHEALSTIRGPDGFGVIPFGAGLDIKGLAASDSKAMGDALASNWQHIAATLLGSDGTMTRGSGVYSAPIFAGVRRDLVDRDLKSQLRGINQGHIETQLVYNYSASIAEASSWIQPVLDIPLPDPDADARIKSYAERVEKLHAIVKAERDNGFEVTQERVSQIAASLEVEEPVLAAVENRTVNIALAPTDVAKVVRVDEARASQGLPPIGDERGQLMISELDNLDDGSGAQGDADKQSSGNSRPSAMSTGQKAQEKQSGSAESSSEVTGGGTSTGGETKSGSAEKSK